MSNAAILNMKWGNPYQKSFEFNYMTTISWYDSFSKKNRSLYCHKLSAPYFKSFLEDLSTIYNIIDLSCFNVRNIRGSDKISQHAFGNAIDINPETNPRQEELQTDMPQNIIELSSKHHLEWGGSWQHSLKDPMHFEYTGK